MANLTSIELEAIIDTVEDPLQRSIEGLSRLQGEQSQKYARSYVELILASGEDQPGNIAQALNILAHEEREVSGKQYLERICTEESSPADLASGVRLALSIGMSTFAKDFFASFVNRAYATVTNDEEALILANIAAEIDSLDETADAAITYIDRRVEEISNPPSLTAFDMDSMFRFLQVYNLECDEAEPLYIATSFFTHRWHSNDYCPQVTEENMEEQLAQSWDIAQQLWDHTQSVEGLRSLLYHEGFQQEYSNDPLAKSIARRIVEDDLQRTEGFSSVKAFAATYQLQNIRSMIGNAISVHLEQGRYQSAERLSEEFHYRITTARKNHVRESLVQEVENCRGNVDKMIDATVTLKSYDHYVEHGIDSSRLPIVTLPERYSGKILLIEFDGKTYLRSGGNWHRDILEDFYNEVRVLGFSSRPHQAGGAHIGFNGQGNRIIHGDSGDFGACDKRLAKQLVMEAFPDTEVFTQ